MSEDFNMTAADWNREAAEAREGYLDYDPENLVECPRCGACVATDETCECGCCDHMEII